MKINGFPKYAAKDALAVIDGSLSKELSIHRFDKPARTKSHLFSINGPLGKQFGILLGNTNVQTGHHPAEQTTIVLQRSEVPRMEGVEVVNRSSRSARLQQQDSKIPAGSQSLVLVADELALKRLLRWYAGK
jgi:hypothetical protein